MQQAPLSRSARSTPCRKRSTPRTGTLSVRAATYAQSIDGHLILSLACCHRRQPVAMTSNASAQLVPIPAASKLDRLPYHSLHRIAEFLSGPNDRVALLNLGLAAPNFYTPCLRVAIQTETRFHWIHSEDAIVTFSSDYDLIAIPVRVIARSLLVPSHSTAVEGTMRSFLILPPRTANRDLVPVPCSTSLVKGASRRWTVVPIPFHKLSSFRVHTRAYPASVPPRCRSLTICGEKLPTYGGRLEWERVTIPQSVTDLFLYHVVPKPITKAAELETALCRLPLKLR
ncbi:hypothetical protein AMAG_19003 [Allomyces macrogynus ATCC 38327]|uniref:Uncharacterized protein n=1 Tax=Allomyces macrogynus (strain ATCC 38327) TaxID=578462 RepID=A0A0L0SLP6_ALLM3|nr:hypothetical protein, variant [Allomyces macrogynus ATCC 38327]KNE63443.1 hypothetical protein AMAG_19003 [Allomyces macrogynus ATCC 38327]|eukprot:KNE63442.1 hypothetical protein, variant [Allomyces macrogynus ATCC 38327]